jgi:hypothetical protein
VIGQHFPDQFLPPAPGGDREAWAWARQEARRLPRAILACLDPFTLRDRIAGYECDYRRHPERGALANLLLLRAVLDQTVTWHPLGAGRWPAGLPAPPRRVACGPSRSAPSWS